MPLRWEIFVGLVLAIIVGGAVRWAGGTLIEMGILIFLTEIVIGIASLDWHLRLRPSQRVEHIEKEDDIVDRARKMRGRAKHEIHCIWCSMGYGDELKKYFEEFRNLKATIYRLISVNKHNKAEVVDHLRRFISELKDGKYVVSSTTHEAFEFFVGDRGESLLLIPHPTKYGLSEGIYVPDEDFAHAIVRMHEGLTETGTHLSIPRHASDTEARAAIVAWVDANCT